MALSSKESPDEVPEFDLTDPSLVFFNFFVFTPLVTIASSFLEPRFLLTCPSTVFGHRRDSMFLACFFRCSTCSGRLCRAAVSCLAGSRAYVHQCLTLNQYLCPRVMMHHYRVQKNVTTKNVSVLQYDEFHTNWNECSVSFTSLLFYARDN